MNTDKNNIEAKQKGMMTNLMRLLGYLTRYKVRFTLMIIIMIGYSVMLAIIPTISGIIMNILSGSSGSLTEFQNIIVVLVVAVILFWIFGNVSQRILAGVAQKALYNLRTEIFSKIHRSSLNFFDKRPIGELMSNVTNDLDVVDQFLSVSFMTVMQAFITVAIASIFMVFINPYFTILTYITILGMLAVSGFLSRIAGQAFVLLQEQMAELNGYAEERMSGQKTVVASNQQWPFIQKFDKMSKKVDETGERAQLSSMTNTAVAVVFQNLQNIIIFVVGGYLVLQQQATFGDLVAFIGFSSILMAPLTQIFAFYNQIISAAVGAGRVFHIMDEKTELPDKKDAPSMPPVEGHVEFVDVDFSYVPGHKILKNNSFNANPGQMIGLCGPTGAGKSTIMNILTRYYDLDSGEIRVDDHRVDEVQQDTLRIQIAQVLQEPFLFTDTIMNNLKYAREGATDEDCIHAAKQANAHDFIMRQPHGYDTMLRGGGADLSQGQRQMLTIARAMVADPHMLILDEATSNVDTRTEKLIQEGLLKLQEGKTSFIIAHRLSTIQNSDQILVINDGKIIERGTHHELLDMKGFYYDLYMSQFRGKVNAVLAGK
ncbi:ABC transporter ATP-binding protein [Methanobacterium petrolearium]|uniref:ABC transporter ATP-binding protein n=1 Tax=Methanobacterium petrolearium TaxID=710190 RepID=UPI001AE37EF4|nr:ABC transporter ATP-binding protein [Methanobacterium petrolearium]MBP1946128.1 ATP-binding cassette subfamily B protein [Methanobacterium petrolearium]BDZ70731.1 multidrug ABC transporter ATP-binding protein [Methanobacterium petrolearium]